MNTKIALVTGGSRGLGKDMALSLAKKGIDVVLTYHSKEAEAQQVVADIEQLGRKAATLQLNMENLNTYDAFFDTLGGVLKTTFGTDKMDYLVNNAGVGATIPFMQATETQFDMLMNIHYKGVFFFTQKAVGMMNNHGGIVNISSGTTRFCNPGYSIYASLKAAVENLTRYMAKELGDRGIRANIVAPGPVETDFNNAAIRSNPQLKSILSGLSPLGRVGNADDIGGVVAFLCTDDAKWINGQRIEVSGGINM